MVEIMETSLNPVLSLSLNRTVTKQINTIRWRDSLGRGSGAGQDPRQIELEMVMLIGKVWKLGGETLFYKDCSLGSVKNLTTSPC